MEVFTAINPPAGQESNEIRYDVRWFTWSFQARAFLTGWDQATRDLEVPPLTHLLGGKEYDYTYTLDVRQAVSQRLHDDLRALANSIFHLAVQDELWLFTDLLGDYLSGRGLHILFASLRHEIAQAADNQMAALYAPLSSVGPVAGEFPLHADLYVPEILFNVFEEVPTDGGGASVFLSVCDLDEILSATSDVPPSVRIDLMRCLREPISHDSYEFFYGLLHDPAALWYPRLSRALKRRCGKITMRSGQGYMIHDRRWLHGRTKVRGGVSVNRLHRLIFESRQGKAALA
jgi:hypothetical protein